MNRRKERDVSWSTLGKAGIKGWLIGVAGSAVVFYVVSLLGAIPRDVYVYAEAQQPFTLTAVVVTTAFVTVVAVPIFRVLVRATKDPIFYFRILATLIFILMIPLPFSIEGAPTGMKIAILLMHLIVTWAIVISLERGSLSQE